MKLAAAETSGAVEIARLPVRDVELQMIGGQADADALLPEVTIQRIDSACDRFESSFRKDRSARIEDYLGGFSGEVRRKLVCELLAIEVEYRIEQGESVRAADYRDRFPDYADHLEQILTESASEGGADRQVALELQSTRIDSARGAVRERDGRNEASGQQFGDYTLLDEIARGGMGVVYRALQTNANRVVALKMILTGQSAGDEEVLRFRNEAEAAALLDHPNIVPVFDVGEVEGQPYFTMGFVEGESLSGRLKDGPMLARQAAKLMKEITEAIEYAHAKGVVHRDLKPSNVLIDGKARPRVTDFGLAKQVKSDSGLTATGQILGTPSYMPPEQALGMMADVDERSDIYSLGAILYCLMTGRPPFQAAQVLETLKQVVEDAPVDPRTLDPTIDRDIETICLKCLEKDRGRRYQTAGELGAELGRYLRGEPIIARPIRHRERLWRWCKRRPVEAALIGAVAAALLMGAGVSTYFGTLARHRADQAERGTRAAVTALETMIREVQNELVYIPEAQDIRRDLLTSALKSLDEVAGELRTQDAVDQNRAAALVDLAKLYLSLGDEDGIRADANAEAMLSEATDIFAQLCDESPQDAQLHKDYGRALALLSGFHVKNGRAGEAKELAERSVAVYERLHRNNPDDLMNAVLLGTAYCERGDCDASRRDFIAAIGWFRKAVALADHVYARAPENVQVRHVTVMAYEKIGDAFHDLGRHNDALPAYQRILKISRLMYEAEPNAYNTMDELSLSYERIGNHWLAVDQPAKAIDAYRKGFELTAEAVEKFPENFDLQEGLRIMKMKLQRARAALESQATAR